MWSRWSLLLCSSSALTFRTVQQLIKLPKIVVAAQFSSQMQDHHPNSHQVNRIWCERFFVVFRAIHQLGTSDNSDIFPGSSKSELISQQHFEGLEVWFGLDDHIQGNKATLTRHRLREKHNRQHRSCRWCFCLSLSSLFTLPHSTILKALQNYSLSYFQKLRVMNTHISQNWTHICIGIILTKIVWMHFHSSVKMHLERAQDWI